MTKEKWLEHIKQATGENPASMAAVQKHFADCPKCPDCAARRKTKNANRAARDKRAVYASCGLKRVKGALGGVYYE